MQQSSKKILCIETVSEADSIIFNEDVVFGAVELWKDVSLGRLNHDQGC